MTGTGSSSASVMPPVLTLDRLFRARISDSPIIPPLGNVPAANSTAKFFVGNYLSRETCGYQEVVTMVSEELGNQLRTKIDTKAERAVLQQLNGLLPALPESEVHSSLDIARTDWIVSLEGQKWRR